MSSLTAARTENFDDAYARIREALGIRTQVQLAEVLCIRQSSISDAKRRGSIPSDWLLTLGLDHGLHPVWVLTGTGGKYLVASDQSTDMLLGSEVDRIRAEAAERARQDVIDGLGVSRLLSLLRQALPQDVTLRMEMPGGASDADLTNGIGGTVTGTATPCGMIRMDDRAGASGAKVAA
ncbi:bacteriophage CI repressor [Desulfovibrio oxamicus]|uniref:Bacteriophage CI repressor n=1 Tax=Nitratidesulfovibrio oxamicus TaxID=32016 RepID=A0ABS0IZK8_9BACT|nr:helix-turn-helix domain-containing protein [Nitratidesulfovibrio oxamicus]MBG3875564.1 bacteriophage CI repressor [Nitratidesulfovibrio oxamicus]